MHRHPITNIHLTTNKTENKNMKKKILAALLLMGIALFGTAQNLQNFTANLNTKDAGSNYLSIANKKVYTQAEAKANKTAIDLALIISQSGTQKIEWYNMSGKDGKIPAELRGTATAINAISFDKDQFDKCKTNQDLKRMTGYITNNAFSHFASVGEKEVTYHCFIIQLENGKRALLWLDAIDATTYKVTVKLQA
jgi:hypothetical protein